MGWGRGIRLQRLSCLIGEELRETSPHNSVSVMSLATSMTKQAPDSLFKYSVYSFIEASKILTAHHVTMLVQVQAR